MVVGARAFMGFISAEKCGRSGDLVSPFLWMVQYWIERLFFESPRANLVFALIATGLLFVVTFISALQPEDQRIFHQKRGT